MKEQLILAIKASLEAGKLILDVYASDDFDIQIKSDDSPLTKADRLANDRIVAILEKSGIPILSEEGSEIPFSERKDWELCWIVDPLDGTKEFINRNGEFTVNIALIKNGDPILGVVFAPYLDVLYYASSDGAFKIESVIKKQIVINHLLEHSIKLPLIKPQEQFKVVASKSHLTPRTKEFIVELSIVHPDLEMVSVGSSLKLCLIAEGSADCYPRFAPTMEWDIAAGHALCRFAGKNVYLVETNGTLTYNRENLRNPWFIAR